MRSSSKLDPRLLLAKTAKAVIDESHTGKMIDTILSTKTDTIINVSLSIVDPVRSIILSQYDETIINLVVFENLTNEDISVVWVAPAGKTIVAPDDELTVIVPANHTLETSYYLLGNNIYPRAGKASH